MLYRIQNFGPSKDVIVKGVKIYLTRNQRIDTDDAEFAKEAAKHPNVDVEELLDQINYFDLRKIAQERGIEIEGKVKKNELIKLIKSNS